MHLVKKVLKCPDCDIKMTFDYKRTYTKDYILGHFTADDIIKQIHTYN
jgi:hypothetical protein